MSHQKNMYTTWSPGQHAPGNCACTDHC